MKAKLSKSKDGGYILLHDPSGWGIGSTDHEYVANHRGEQIVSKLSKQNCNEIFGVVDLMKLAEENSHKHYDVKTTDWHCNYNGFFSGFQEAMELNKDKVFTLEDMYYIFQLGFSLDGKAISKLEYDTHIQSLQQPTEIEVTFNPEEKDSEGCLILKKI